LKGAGRNEAQSDIPKLPPLNRTWLLIILNLLAMEKIREERGKRGLYIPGIGWIYTMEIKRKWAGMGLY
jgi:hypothetical protein